MLPGIELDIFKGTHFTASAPGHGRPLYAKNALKLRDTKVKSKFVKANSSMTFLQFEPCM